MGIKLLILAAFFLVFGVKPSLASSVVLNEIMTNPPSGEKEWVELYNTSSTMNISGWVIEERTGSDLSGTKQHLLPDFTIQNNGFWTFDFATASLNNSGDIVTLKDNSGTTIDTYQYTSSTQSKTFGRQPDSGSWTSNLSPTKNLSNGGISIPTPTPTATPTPTPTSTSTSTTSTTPSSSFTISNIPSQIDSTEEFRVTINLSLPKSPNTIFYLKGAFKKQDKTNYFGLTKVGNDWIKNNNKFEDQYKITTDGSGNWSGNLEIQPDILDSGYEGAGEYLFKVARYTGSGSLTWSNEIIIKINAQEVVLENDSDVLGVEEKQVETSESKPKKEEYSLEKYIKVTTQSATPLQTDELRKSKKQISPFIIIGGVFILGALGYLVYRYQLFSLKSKLNEIQKLFRK